MSQPYNNFDLTYLYQKPIQKQPTLISEKTNDYEFEVDNNPGIDQDFCSLYIKINDEKDDKRKNQSIQLIQKKSLDQENQIYQKPKITRYYEDSKKQIYPSHVKSKLKIIYPQDFVKEKEEDEDEDQIQCNICLSNHRTNKCKQKTSNIQKQQSNHQFSFKKVNYSKIQCFYCLQFDHVNCSEMQGFKSFKKILKIDDIFDENYRLRVIQGRSLFKKVKHSNRESKKTRKRKLDQLERDCYYQTGKKLDYNFISNDEIFQQSKTKKRVNIKKKLLSKQLKKKQMNQNFQSDYDIQLGKQFRNLGQNTKSINQNTIKIKKKINKTKNTIKSKKRSQRVNRQRQ